jgi:hypothetical protein
MIVWPRIVAIAILVASVATSTTLRAQRTATGVRFRVDTTAMNPVSTVRGRIEFAAERGRIEVVAVAARSARGGYRLKGRSQPPVHFRSASPRHMRTHRRRIDSISN